MSETILAGLLGGTIASLLSLVGVLLINRTKMASENVIKQRAAWRESVRALIVEAINVEEDRAARRIWAELALRLNPDDPTKDDHELVALLRDLQNEAGRTAEAKDRIVLLASRILKHDWTRAKWEAQGWFWEEEPKQTRTLPESA